MVSSSFLFLACKAFLIDSVQKNLLKKRKYIDKIHNVQKPVEYYLNVNISLILLLNVNIIIKYCCGVRDVYDIITQ